MKKLVFTILAVMFMVTGCAANSSDKSAAGLLQAFKDAEMSIISEEVYTSETDPNKKMGRPGGYIEKINFNDSNFYDEDDSPDISIEVFSSKKDMEKRRDYIKAIVDASDMNAFKYYIYDADKILFRIPYIVTPEAAAEYEEIFNDYISK